MIFVKYIFLEVINVKIMDIQRDIEESLASVTTSTLPSALAGLRHLPLSDRNPQVSIRYLDKGRKVREDADGSYFDPDSCEVVIQFVAFDAADEGTGANISRFSGHTDELDYAAAMDQLLQELRRVEGTRPFVGLKWFRDRLLPTCGHDWARDVRTSGALLRQASAQHLILTSQVPNPNQPAHPVTAIRINRRHPRFQPKEPDRRTRFKPIRIRGGAISDTVLGGRR